MAFDPTKPVQTRDGRPVTILATGVLERIPGTYGSRLPGQTILASIDGGVPTYFHPCGTYDPRHSPDGLDLVNVPEKAEPSGQSEHTPGPWTATPTGDEFVISAPDPDYECPLAVACVYADGGAEGTDTPANARLIAAAPELYEIAERILERGYVSKHIAEERNDHLALKAALAKARGEA